MITLIKLGGFPMWFVLAFGLIALASAARFAILPRLTRLPFVQSMAAATLYATLTCMAADLATVFNRLPNDPEWMKDPNWHFTMILGISESLSPCILGFGMLGLTSLLVAVGRSRETIAA